MSDGKKGFIEFSEALVFVEEPETELKQLILKAIPLQVEMMHLALGGHIEAELLCLVLIGWMWSFILDLYPQLHKVRATRFKVEYL